MHTLFSRRHRKSSPYGSYPDSSDDKAYCSEHGGRPRTRSLSRQSFDLEDPARCCRSGTPHSEKRRAQSVDRQHYYHRRSRPVSPRRARHQGRAHHHGRKRRDESEQQSQASQRKLKHAINAAIDAAAVEVFRLRKEPGEWIGAKGTRVATAAVGAAVLDARHDGYAHRHSKWTLAKSTLGGLVANRLLNGPRHDLRYHQY